MKIRGKKTEPSIEVDRDRRTQQANEAAKRKSSSSKAHADETKVDLSLSKAIHRELDASAIGEERAAKVQRLKDLVAAGKYDPPIDSVAQAVGEEIVFEIMSRGPLSAQEE